VRALTDEQEQAVARREGSLLLAAGAGSGKTSVLVERFVRAVREDGVAPGRILAITFTERAAGELRERVRARLLELGEREEAREAEAANVCTFHGFCARLLRVHPLQAGVEPGFEILDESFSARLRLLAFSDALACFLDGERAEAVDLVAAYDADPLRAMVLAAHAQLRSQGQSNPRLPVVGGDGSPPGVEVTAVDGGEEAVVGEQSAVRACALIGELLERFDAAYVQRKHARGALDFDDLELHARDLLRRRAEVREAWAERFELLMVDEFQDSNPRQLELLGALDCDNLFTVGDQLQSIYSFRHADVGLFRERHAQLSERGATLALTRNFRSRPAILAAVERIFARRMGERFAPLAPARSEDDGEPIVELLLTDKRGWERAPAAGDERTGYDALDGLPEATPWRQAEARLLAARLADLLADGQARAGEIVVLLRSLSDLPVYESALRAHDLPTLASVGGFWGHQQVGDLLSWLRVLANPLDELALYSTLASPLVGVSSDGLALIASAARARRVGVWQAMSENGGELRYVLPEADRERVGAFCELLAAERKAMALHPIAELLRRAIVATGYEAHVLSLDWGERRLANMHKLVELARRFEAREGRELRGFLDHVAHAEVGREANAPVGDGESDAVRLMSIHAAKGLEFSVVCVADLGREPNMRAPDLLVDGASGTAESAGRVGLRLRVLGNPEAVPALHYEELREARALAQEEEEDRVLYVACTRAKNRLLLSGAVAFERWPAVKPGVAPIAWLAPALVPDTPELATAEHHPERALSIDTGGGLLVRCVFNAPVLAEEVAAAGAGGEAIRARAPRSGAVTSVLEQEPASELVGSGGVLGRGPTDGMAVRVASPVARAPSPLTDPDTTMSYTSLAELERCGYRYYLERVLRLAENRAAAQPGRPGSEDAGIEARLRGTIVHMLLESVNFAHPRPPSERDVVLVARQIGAKLAPAMREEIAALIAAALDSEPARVLAGARHARSEHPFAFSLGAEEPLVTGVLDLIVERADGTSLIVDYKSDRLTAREDLERLVLRDYGFQRLLYALAAIENGAHSVEVAHWFLQRPNEWVSARFRSIERDGLRKQLLERIARVRAMGFTVTNAPHRGICLTCPGRQDLCQWGETRTMSARSPTLESDEIGGRLND
jgi:ATP-dependent helicase/nuclease subunit A